MATYSAVAAVAVAVLVVAYFRPWSQGRTGPELARVPADEGTKSHVEAAPVGGPQPGEERPERPTVDAGNANPVAPETEMADADAGDDVLPPNPQGEAPGKDVAAAAEIPAGVPADVEKPGPIPVAPVKPKRDPIDVAARLRQPLIRFEQVRPATARGLIEQLEEMTGGVPIVFDVKELGDAAAGLDRNVSLSLKSPTLADVLQAVVEKAGLRWEIDGETIRIRRREEN